MQTYTLRVAVTDQAVFTKVMEVRKVPGACIEEVVDGNLFNDREAMSAYSKYVVAKTKEVMTFDEFYETWQETTHPTPTSKPTTH